MTKNRVRKPLQLQATTLRELQSKELVTAAAGRSTCYTGVNNNCNPCGDVMGFLI